MTKVVTGPDGKKHQFPDSATSEQIQGVLKKHYGMSEAPAKPSSGFRGAFESTAQGAFLGYSDELRGMIRGAKYAVLGKEGGYQKGYESGRDEARRELQEFGEAHPYARAGLTVAGAVPTAAISPSVRVAQGAGLLARMGAAGATGAGYGAVTGFGAGEGGAAERARGAIGGAVIGGGVGAAVPLVAAGAKGVFHAAGGGNAKELANQKLLQAMQRDALTPDEALSRYRAGQAVSAKPETVADIGGKNVQGLTRAVTGVPGPAKEIADDFLVARAMGDIDDPLARTGAAARVGQDAAKALNIQQSYETAFDDLNQIRKAAAKPAYDAAYRAGEAGVWSDDLAKLIKRPSIGAAWERAKRIAGDEGIELPEIFVTDAKGNITGTRRIPSLQVWDYMKRGLDDVVQSHKEPITGKIKTDAARAVNQVRKELVATLDDAVPEYKAARAEWAGPTRNLEAMEYGKNVFSESPNDIRSELTAMTAGEREFFRIGVAKAIEDQASKTRNTGNVMLQVAQNPLNRKRLGAAMGNKSYIDFIRELGRENRMAQTASAVRGGSPTQPRLSEVEDLADIAGAARDVATGNLPGLIGRVWDAASKRGRGLTPEVNKALAEALLNPNKTAQTFQMLKLLERTSGKRYGMADALVRGGGMTAGQVTGQR